MAPRAESREDTQLRNPIDFLTHGLPRQWRIAIDWAVTILGAVAIVLAIKAYVVNPYRIPSSSMEPTLALRAPRQRLQARFSDRVLANRLHLPLPRPEARRDRRLQDPSGRAGRVQRGRGRNGGDTFVKRLVGLPGDRWREQDGFIYINGERLDEPYIEARAQGCGHDPREDRSPRAST